MDPETGPERIEPGDASTPEPADSGSTERVLAEVEAHGHDADALLPLSFAAHEDADAGVLPPPWTPRIAAPDRDASAVPPLPDLGASPGSEMPAHDVAAHDHDACPSPPPPIAVRPATWSRGDVAGIAIAAVGGAAIVLTLLVPRTGHLESIPAAAASRAATPVRAAVAPAAHASSAVLPSHGWQQAAQWVGRTRKSVAFELEADRSVRAWMRQVRPLLVVRCLSGNVDAFVVTQSPSSLEPGRSDHTVRVAFDAETPAVEHWADSAEHDGLFAPDGTRFLDRLARARTLRVSFTPHNAPEATVGFDLAGVDGIVGPVRKYCR